ncbi:Polyadenylate-binding protein 4 [Marasmius crinis-equi]|uniref:Polyadenylate-binding protein 4 n=1 Tax=Marasmius crinis-equi TaxID=585013 RepID=A0ABR3F0V7_9AGAR
MFVNNVQRRCWSRSSSLLKRLSSTSTEPRKTVYLRNLPFQTNIKQIEQLAERYGALARVTTPPDQWNRPAGFGYVSFQKAEDARRFCEAVNGKHGEGLTGSDGHERDVTAELVEEHRLEKRPMPESRYLHLTRFLVPPAVEEIQAHLTQFGQDVAKITPSQGYTRPFVDVEFRTHAAAVKAHEELQRTPIIFDGRQISVDFGVKAERSTPTNFLFFRGTLRVTRQEEEFLEMLKPHDALVRGVKFNPPAEGRSYISGLIECTSKAAAADIKKAFGDKIMLEYSFRTKFLEFTVKDVEIARKEDLVELFKPYGSTIQGVGLFPPRPDRQSLSGRIEFTYTRAAIEFQAAVGERLEMKYVKPPEGQDDGAETLSLSSSTVTQKTMISDRIVCLENLPPHATEGRVKELASAYGAIARVALPKRADGQPGGFANVQFRYAAGAKAFHKAVMGKEQESSEGGAIDGISMDGQRLTARLVEEYQKPPSNILHMTGFGARPTKAVLIRFFEGFEEDIVDVVISTKTSDPFAQVHFTSSEAATKAHQALIRSGPEFEGQKLRAYFAKKAIGGRKSRSPSGSSLGRDDRRDHQPQDDPNVRKDVLYFSSTVDKEEIQELLYPHSILIRSIKYLPPRDNGSSSGGRAGFINCNEAGAAAFILEAYKDDDRIRLGYARASPHTDEVETSRNGGPTSRAAPSRTKFRDYKELRGPETAPAALASDDAGMRPSEESTGLEKVLNRTLSGPSAPSTSSPSDSVQPEPSNLRFAAIPEKLSGTKWGRGGPVLKSTSFGSRANPEPINPSSTSSSSSSGGTEPEPSKLRFAEPPEMLRRTKWAKGGPVLKPISPGLKMDHAPLNDAIAEWEDIPGLDPEPEESEPEEEWR